MDTLQYRQVQNYLSWIQERGQIWPVLSHIPASSNQVSPCLTAPSSALNKEPLVTQAGSLQAEYLAVTTCLVGQKIVFGPERDLLIKMMQALGIDLKTNFCLLGLNTALPNGDPLAELTAYRLEFRDWVQRLRPRAIFAFGNLAADLLPPSAGQPVAFSERVDRWQNYPCAGSAYHFLPLQHLHSLLRTPSLKLGAWQALQQLNKPK